MLAVFPYTHTGVFFTICYIILGHATISTMPTHVLVIRFAVGAWSTSSPGLSGVVHTPWCILLLGLLITFTLSTVNS